MSTFSSRPCMNLINFLFSFSTLHTYGHIGNIPIRIIRDRTMHQPGR